jgi:hypothetical protein
LPYINQHDRLDAQHWRSVGDLNYAITKLCDDYIRLNGTLNYARINEVIGVLTCAKLEFYRRVAAGYENKKKLENGDVYNVAFDVV